MKSSLDISTQAGPILVTLAYLLLYYVFQFHVMRVKNRLRAQYKARGEKFDRYFGQDREMLAADRVQLNMLEHMPVFLTLLWLNAVFVGPFATTVAGAVYVAARGLYPFVMGRQLGRGIRASVLVATVPGYVVLVYFIGRLAGAMLGAPG